MLTDEEIERIADHLDDYREFPGLRALITQAREANQLRAELARAAGPHCTGCGSAIDPDWCWCGSASGDHGSGDGHSPVSMGCSCHQSSDRDWIRSASLLREQAWRDRAQIDALRADLASAQQLVQLFGNQLAEIVEAAIEVANCEEDYNTSAVDRLVDLADAYVTWLATHPHANYAGTVTVQPGKGEQT